MLHPRCLPWPDAAAIPKQHINVYARRVLVPCRAGGKEKPLQLKANENAVLKAVRLPTIPPEDSLRTVKGGEEGKGHLSPWSVISDLAKADSVSRLSKAPPARDTALKNASRAARPSAYGNPGTSETDADARPRRLAQAAAPAARQHGEEQPRPRQQQLTAPPLRAPQLPADRQHGAGPGRGGAGRRGRPRTRRARPRR